MRTVNGFGTIIYGRAKRRNLEGSEAVQADAQGYLPTTYQAVKWFVVVFLPIFPLGTFVVMRKRQRFWSLADAEYLMQETDWDWAQVIRHYLIGLGILAVPILLSFLKDLF